MFYAYYLNCISYNNNLVALSVVGESVYASNFTKNIYRGVEIEYVEDEYCF